MRSIFKILSGCIALYSVFTHAIADTNELTGSVSMNGRIFLNSPRLKNQETHHWFLKFNPEYYYKSNEGKRITFKPYIQYNLNQRQELFLDIRELNLSFGGEDWAFQAGIGKVFWGVTEFVHLVDIINQSDLVAAINGEEKLGQPLIQTSMVTDWGDFEIFILPYFRERTFPEKESRLRSDLIVDTDHAQYENKAKETHPDVAFRYYHSIGNLDLGLSYFSGTSREPSFRLKSDNTGIPIGLIPYYSQINQISMDLQLIIDQWLLKNECIYRNGMKNRAFADEAYFSSVIGFEYTFVNLAGSYLDLGVISEWAYDQREEDATTAFQNDAMFGLRLVVNNMAGTEMLLGYIHDLDHTSKMISLETNSRLSNRWKINLESMIFLEHDKDDINYDLRDDDFFLVELVYYF